MFVTDIEPMRNRNRFRIDSFSVAKIPLCSIPIAASVKVGIIYDPGLNSI